MGFQEFSRKRFRMGVVHVEEVAGGYLILLHRAVLRCRSLIRRKEDAAELALAEFGRFGSPVHDGRGTL